MRETCEEKNVRQSRRPRDESRAHRGDGPRIRRPPPEKQRPGRNTTWVGSERSRTKNRTSPRYVLGLCLLSSPLEKAGFNNDTAGRRLPKFWYNCHSAMSEYNSSARTVQRQRPRACNILTDNLVRLETIPFVSRSHNERRRNGRRIHQPSLITENEVRISRLRRSSDEMGRR